MSLPSSPGRCEGAGKTVDELYSELSGPYELDSSKNSGAMCVHFVVQGYGGRRPFAEIAEKCQLSRSGTTLERVDTALERLGLSTTGFSATAAALKRLRYPAVIRMRPTNEHDVRRRGSTDFFMVVLGWEQESRRFRVFDPPREQREISFADLKQQFTGTGLVVTRHPLDSMSDAFHPSPPRVLAFIMGAVLAIALAARIRRRSVSLVLVSSLLVLPPFGCSRSEQAEINTHFFDAGIIAPGTTLSHTFRVYNRSSQPLRFLRVEGDCACATGLLGDLPVSVKPGQFAEVDVTVDTTDFNGPTERNLAVLTDAEDPSLKAIPLALRFDAFRAVTQAPTVIYFDEVEAGQMSAQTIEIRLHHAELVQSLESIRCRGSWLSASLVRVRGNKLKLKVVLKPAKKMQGTLIGDIVMTFNHSMLGKSFTIPVVARIPGDFQITPDRIVKNLPVQGSRSSQKLRIRSLSKRPFRVIEVIPPDIVQVDVADSDTVDISHDVLVTWPDKMNWSALSPIVLKTDRLEDLYVYLQQ